MSSKKARGFQKGNLHASLKNANKVSRFPFDSTVAKKEQAYTKSRTSRRCSCYHPENCREIQDEYDRLGMNDRVGYTRVCKPKEAHSVDGRYAVYQQELIRQQQRDLENLREDDLLSFDEDVLTVACSHFPPDYLDHIQKRDGNIVFCYQIDGF